MGKAAGGGGAASALIQSSWICRSTREPSVSALQAHFLAQWASQPQKEEVVCVKISRQGLATGAAVRLPGHCQILETTLTSCQDELGTEKKRKGRGQVAKWSLNSCVFIIWYNFLHVAKEDNFIIDQILSFIAQIWANQRFWKILPHKWIKFNWIQWTD